MPRLQRLSKPLDLQYEYSRLNLVARIVTMVVIPVAGSFCLIHLSYGNWLEACFSALITLLAGGVWVNCKPGLDPERSRFRLKLLFIAFVGSIFLFEVYTAATYKLYSRLVWFYPIPLVVYFMLGRRIGMAVALVLLGALIFLLDSYLQRPTQILIVPGDVWRFIAVFFIMGLVGYFMEREFRRDRTALLTKQAALERSESLYREACMRLVDQINKRSRAEHTTQGLIEQARHSQKMEALGQLAGGIAHDVNNLLGSMIAFTQVAQNDLPPNHPQKEKLDLALKAGNQAKTLLRRMLDFSRHEDSDRQPVFLGRLLRESLDLVHPLLAPSVGLRVNLPESSHDDLVVNANSGQIQQVLFNLCQNASQAMAPEGGTLTIELCEAKLAPEDSCAPDCQPAGYAKLMVSDTGPGMSPQSQARAFEPFFTTKGKGQGTGMGLFVSRAIVSAHGGKIMLHNTRPFGTQFTIYLPLCQNRPAEQIPVQAADLPKGGGELVLYVDDEESLALSVTLVLRELGYHAQTCKSGEAALEILDHKSQAVDLVICDQNMGGMRGTDLARECRRLYPRIPVILTTGDAGQLNGDELAALGLAGVLAKPVSARSLAVAVHQALPPRGKGLAISNGLSGLPSLPGRVD